MSDTEENHIHIFVTKIYIFLQYNSQPSKHKTERVILSVSEISIPSFIPNVALRPMAMQIYLVKHA